MSDYTNLYKRYQCRYFDDDGRALNPSCNQGDSCRFIHPSDPNWPGVKFVDKRNPDTSLIAPELTGSGPHKTSVTHYTKGRTKPAFKFGISSPNTRTRQRSTPLVSQADLFQSCKVETEVDVPLHDEDLRHEQERVHPRQRALDRGSEHYHDHDRDRGRERDRGGGRDRSKNASTSAARAYDSRSYLGVKRPDDRSGSDRSSKTNLNAPRSGPARTAGDLQSNEADGRPLREYGDRPPAHFRDSPGAVVDNHDALSSAAHSGVPLIASPAIAVPGKLLAETAPPEPFGEKKRAQKFVELFRGLAKASNQIVQNTMAHDREEKKLQTYTEISSTLSKISASAATAVAPTLASIFLNHAQCKQRVEDNLKTLGGLWEEVFDVFVTEIVDVIDAVLDDALAKMKEERENPVRGIIADSAGALKRKVGGAVPSTSSTDDRRGSKRSRLGTRGFVEKELEETRPVHGLGTSRDRKCRWLAPSSSQEPESRQKSEQLRVEALHTDVDSSIEEILESMKSKIDQQALSLQTLTKENNELKTTLQKQTLTTPMTSSCTSFSTSPNPRGLRHQTSGSSRLVDGANINTTSERTNAGPSLSIAQLDYFRSSL